MRKSAHTRILWCWLRQLIDLKVFGTNINEIYLDFVPYTQKKSYVKNMHRKSSLRVIYAIRVRGYKMLFPGTTSGYVSDTYNFMEEITIQTVDL